MVAVELKEPRPGAGIKKAELTRPGAQMTLVALVPEAGASMAVLKWTNPEGKSKVLRPGEMEVAALQELPLAAQAPGAAREIDVAAARAAIQAALPPGGPTPDAPVFIYSKGSLAGAQAYLDDATVQVVERSHDVVAQQSHLAQQVDLLRQAIQDLPATHTATVSSSAMSRTLGINSKTRRTSVALSTARDIFPQAADQLRTVKDHVGLANALLVAAHVIGASVGKGPNPESESAAAAAAAQHALAGAVAPGGEAGLPTPSLAAGRPKRARSGAAAAAAAGEASSAPAAPAAAPSQPFHATLAQAFQGRQPGLLAPLAGGLAEGSAQGAMQQQLHIQQMLLQQQVQAEQQQQQQQQEQQRVPLTLQQQVNYLSLMQQLQTMRQLMPAGTQFTAVTMPPATQAPAPAPMPAAGALSGWAMAAPLPLPQPQQQPLPHMPGMGLPGGGTWQMPGLPRVMPGLGMPYLHPGPGAGPGYGGLGVTAGGSSSTAPQQGPYPGMVLPGMGPGAAPLGAMPQAGASGASTGAFPDQQYGQQYFQQYGQQNEQQYTPPGEQAAGGEYAQVPGAPPAQPAGAADESSGEHDQWEEKQAPGQKRARAEGEIGSWAGTLPAQGGGAV